MDQLLQTLLLVYASVLLLNAVFSAICFYQYRNKLYLYSLVLWLATSFTALIEGLFHHSSHLAMALSFSTYILPSLALVQILGFVTGTTFPFRNYLATFVAGLSVTLSTALFGDPGFTLLTLPLAIGIAGPMIHAAFVTLFRRRSIAQRQGAQVYCSLLLMNGIHFLDYPFLAPTHPVLGFTIALLILMGFSIFLPSFVIKSISDSYSENVSELNRKLVEYQNQMHDLMSLAQVGELSFGFLHDMASPMSLLLHYSQEISALQGDAVPTGEKILPYSKGIERATSRLVKLQRMFRNLIRNDIGDQAELIDLRESLQSCVDLYSPFLRKQKIELVMQFPEGGQAAQLTMMIPGVLERVVLNLLQNAANVLIDFPRKKIEILLESDLEANVVTIRDTGPGLPPERKDRVWEKFGHSGTAQLTQGSFAGPRSGGSGFGLYKVKQLVDALGGQISVDSSAEGTTFRITLPHSAERTSRSHKVA